MMEEPVELLTRPPPVLSPCTSAKRRSTSRTATDSNSPEFEFWNMLRNPSFPQPNLLSADELFSDGVLLPLHLLNNHSSDDQKPSSADPPETSGSDQPGPGSRPDVSNVLSALSAPTFTSSKRWKDIFKISGDRRKLEDESSRKEKKKEKKIAGGGGGPSNGGVSAAAELNINIWPFRRSRSAGNGGNRPRMAGAGATRKVSSAPCSRSNSAGESKSRKQWPSSPSRGGVHLGRSSPVWQVRRGAAGGGKGAAADIGARNAEKGAKREVNNEARRKTSVAAVSSSGAAKAKALHLNVPMCIGYRNHLSCRRDENSAVGCAAEGAAGLGGVGGVAGSAHGGGGGSDEGVRGSSNLFKIRSLFTKKVH
ncbi:uncharacterized protein [Coffea arabica]|uniref:Uncharacterized protein n=1 Tax=Coffea arabica TaxID=13443 RepID=A0A6P6U4Q9_COFAR